MIYCIVGKTSSGKDTIAKHLSKRFHIPLVCSATTRAMRCYETNGKEHWFVTKEEMEKIKASPHVIAYTKMPVTGIEYAATTDMVQGDDMIYIINPDGIRWFKAHGSKDIPMVSIYVDLSDTLIVDRAMKRGDKLSDIQDRLASENDKMNKFRDNKEYDYFIDNSGTLTDALKKADRIILSNKKN